MTSSTTPISERVRADARHLDEHRLDVQPLHGLHHGVAALGVTDRDDDVLLFGQVDDRPPLLGIDRQRLFDQHGHPVFDKQRGQIVVRDRRGRDRYRVDVADEVRRTADGLAAELLGQSRGALGIAVGHRHKIGALQLRIHLRVDPAHFPRPDTAVRNFICLYARA